jgi:two-component system chemotaxis sensor kinase CheA
LQFLKESEMSDKQKHIYENISLNDALELLRRIGPDNISELASLEELLNLIILDESYPDASRKKIRQAAQKIEQIIYVSVSDPTSIPPDPVGEVIELIEGAVRSIENKGKTGKSPTDNYILRNADPDILAAFIAESTDLMTGAEEALLKLETEPDNIEPVYTVYRVFHNIKGTSAFFELPFMTEIAFRAETFMGRIRDREIRCTSAHVNLAFRALDMIKEIFRSLRKAVTDGTPVFKPAGYKALIQLLTSPKDKTAPRRNPPRKIPDPVRHISAAHRLDNSSETPVKTAVAEKKEIPEPAVSPQKQPLSEKIPGESEESLLSEERARGREKKREVWVRVPVRKLNQMVDMLGELGVAHAAIIQDKTVVESNHYDLLKKVAQTGKIIRELQYMSMSMRTVPLRKTFRRVSQVVKSIGNREGKKIKFLAEGGNTETDQDTAELIRGILLHILRNTVRYSIEPPDIREKNHKPRAGTVRLSVCRSAANIVIKIEDDGQGYDLGYALPDTADEAGKRAAFLQDHLEIRSEPGKRTVSRICLPLPLSVTDGMVVRVGSQNYVIPLTSVLKSVQPARKDLSAVSHQGGILWLRDRPVPLIRLAHFFKISGSEKELSRSVVTVIEDNGHYAGLVTDEIVSVQQVVIRELGETMQNISGISGATIMADGSVSLILDAGELIRLANAGKQYLKIWTENRNKFHGIETFKF